MLLRCSPTSAPQHADGAGGQKDDADVNKREPGVVDQLDDGVFGELTGFAVVAMLVDGPGARAEGAVHLKARTGACVLVFAIDFDVGNKATRFGPLTYIPLYQALIERHFVTSTAHQSKQYWLLISTSTGRSANQYWSLE